MGRSRCPCPRTPAPLLVFRAVLPARFNPILGRTNSDISYIRYGTRWQRVAAARNREHCCAQHFIYNSLAAKAISVRLVAQVQHICRTGELPGRQLRCAKQVLFLVASVRVSLFVCVSVCTQNTKNYRTAIDVNLERTCKPQNSLDFAENFDFESCFYILDGGISIRHPLCERCRLAAQQTLQGRVQISRTGNVTSISDACSIYLGSRTA